ncbi:hypothetical protein G9A89_015060 [Geosiphon pyriformis]|nr:hypothetical protein G9A89_015060 [Geosiphon pyriformis]
MIIMSLKTQTKNITCFTIYIWLTLRKLNLTIPWNSSPSIKQILENKENTISRDTKIIRYKNRKWSLEETKTLLEARQEYGLQWRLISQKYLPSRTPRAIKDKWYSLTANGEIIKQKLTLSLNKWTPEEDKELYLAAKRYLINNKVDWKAIVLTGLFPGRSNGDLCTRYHHVLVYPKRGLWDKEEEEKFSSLVQRYGKKWAKISHILQRSSSVIRRHYEEHLAPGSKGANGPRKNLLN